jgi:hypothetical protein
MMDSKSTQDKHLLLRWCTYSEKEQFSHISAILETVEKKVLQETHLHG